MRVTFRSLPAPYDAWNGSQFWVTPPVEVCEIGGSGPGEPCPGEPTFLLSELTCDGPVFHDWSVYDRVFISHPGVVPNGTYDIQALDETCDMAEFNFSPALVVTNAEYGDVAAPFNAGLEFWPGADGSVDVTVDVLAVLAAFSTSAGAPTKPRADLEPSEVDAIINITDALHAIDGFTGKPYPFALPGPDPCSL